MSNQKNDDTIEAIPLSSRPQPYIINSRTNSPEPVALSEEGLITITVDPKTPSTTQSLYAGPPPTRLKVSDFSVAIRTLFSARHIFTAFVLFVILMLSYLIVHTMNSNADRRRGLAEW